MFLWHLFAPSAVFGNSGYYGIASLYFVFLSDPNTQQWRRCVCLRPEGLGLLLFFKEGRSSVPQPHLFLMCLWYIEVSSFLIPLLLIFYLLKVDQRGKRNSALQTARGFARSSLRWPRRGGMLEATLGHNPASVWSEQGSLPECRGISQPSF